jgi:transposase
MSALARQLQSRNHDVVMFSPPVGESLARAAGLPFVPFAERVFEKSFTCTDYRRVVRIKNDVDKLYDTDLTDAAWSLIAPILPAARIGGRPRKTNLRAVLNAIFYLLRTGCQWRLLPREFPSWNTVYHYFRSRKNDGVWTCLQRSMYQQVRRQARRAICPSVVIMDGQSVKTTERGGIRGFDAHKRVKGRKRHIVVDIFGLLIACRVELADISLSSRDFASLHRDALNS